ncbi:probable glyoxylate reductase [Rhynchosporium secalis]|uniref:Probable glyoxylate reductase n=1 Tax=Rhynchosporium secalis TaxID=38038 RepID=A0A1E1MCB1_RHYSE|nr:probable glyoxylate reductase [Rhynchosporium secalis]
MPPLPKGPIRLAILDDYQGIAPKHFESLKPTFETTTFQDTLPAFNAPSTPESTKQELITRLKPFTVISSMRERTPFPAELLKSLPNLKLLLTTGGRNAAIDMVVAKSLGIPVTGAGEKGRTPSAAVDRKKRRGPDSTTQHCVALILGIARILASDDRNVKNGLWETDLATGLSGKTFSSLGLGRLGGNVAKIMYQSFGMRVLAWSSSLTQEAADERAKEMGLPVEDEDGKVFKAVSKEELFKEADVLSLHYVLSDRSRGIVGKEDLKLLKKQALFVNTSRGPLVDEDVLLDFLEKGGIRGAAIDVFAVEPLPLDSKWRTTKWGEEGRSNVLLTPHMGYVEEETMNSWYEEQVEIVKRWQNGQDLLNVINK